MTGKRKRKQVTGLSDQYLHCTRFTSCLLKHAYMHCAYVSVSVYICTQHSSIPPCRDATAARAASLFLETTANLQPLSASRRDTAFPMPLEPPHTTASLDMVDTTLQERQTHHYWTAQVYLDLQQPYSASLTIRYCAIPTTKKQIINCNKTNM